MPTENDPQSLTFNQYGILLREINALREEQRQTAVALREDYRETTGQLAHTLSDHEARLRRQETLGIIGVTAVLITVVVVGVVLAILLGARNG